MAAALRLPILVLPAGIGRRRVGNGVQTILLALGAGGRASRPG
jgi:hypothetical protein